MKNFINVNIIYKFVKIGTWMGVLLAAMYLFLFIISLNNYKKNEISKEEFLRITMLDKLIEFRKNYKIRIYMFIIDLIYNPQKYKNISIF